jgi:hypothetical protein
MKRRLSSRQSLFLFSYYLNGYNRGEELSCLDNPANQTIDNIKQCRTLTHERNSKKISLF